MKFLSVFSLRLQASTSSDVFFYIADEEIEKKKKKFRKELKNSEKGKKEVEKFSRSIRVRQPLKIVTYQTANK